MKKTIITIAALFAAVTAFADDVDYVSGNRSILKDKTATACLEVDWSTTLVGQIDDEALETPGVPLNQYLTEKGEEYINDWPEIARNGKDAFETFYNKAFKKGMKISGPSSASYKIIVKIDALDFGNTGGVFGFSAKAGGAIMIGSITYIDIATGEPVLTFKVNEVQGNGHFTENMRIQLMFMELVEELTDAL